MDVESGASVSEALNGISKRCECKAVDRAIALLKQGYESGADLSQTFREAADDLLETNAILRERNAAMVVEKYTLLLAGGTIVPLVLGLLIGMVSSMDSSGFELIGFGSSAKERAEMLELTVLANKIYIVEYALLASLFVAGMEGNWKKSLLYALGLLPLSMFCFAAAAFILAA